MLAVAEQVVGYLLEGEAQRVSAKRKQPRDAVTRLSVVTTRHVDGCAPGPCAAAAASSRYGKRLLTDPDDRLGDPLFGEPAADFGKEAQQPARASAAACSRGTSCRRFAGRCCSGRAPTARRAGPRSVHQVRRPASDISLMRDIHPRCPCRVPAKERQRRRQAHASSSAKPCFDASPIRLGARTRAEHSARINREEGGPDGAGRDDERQGSERGGPVRSASSTSPARGRGSPVGASPAHR